MASPNTLDVRDISAFYFNERWHFDLDGEHREEPGYVRHEGPNRADRRRYLGNNLGRGTDQRRADEATKATIAYAMHLKTRSTR